MFEGEGGEEDPSQAREKDTCEKERGKNFFSSPGILVGTIAGGRGARTGSAGKKKVLLRPLSPKHVGR